MKPRYTWLWATLALGLFAFIFFFERHWREEPPGPARVLPGLNLAAVTSVQVRRAGQLEIRAQRTNGGWWLTGPRPLSYPGEAAPIEGLLTHLAQLQVQTRLAAAELRQHTNSVEEFGMEAPQASLLIQERHNRHQLLVGTRTPAGDQVYLQVVGLEGLHIVSADLLRHLPVSPDAWRATRFVQLDGVPFDRVVVTNANVAFELQRDEAAAAWRLTQPTPARADAARIAGALQRLQQLRVSRFVTDEPHADFESFGLQPPELALTLARGTNPVLQLAFGRSPTNDPAQVFARRSDPPGIVTVAREPLAAWRAAATEFRDLHLVNLTRPVQSIELTGGEAFTLQRVSTNAWRVLPLDVPADPELAAGLVAALGNLQVTQFVKDVVIEPDRQQFGLATPARKVIVKSATPAPGSTNLVLGELEFGLTQDGQTFVRRTDESAVYAVRAADFQALPAAAFQLRDRSLWHVDETDVARVTIQQGGRQRQIERHGTNSWSLAAGSQGIINPFAVEEAVHRLGGLYAIQWVARGETDLARYGFAPDGLRVTLELISGGKLEVRFGGPAPSRLTYAATTLEGQVWVFECPPAVSELVGRHLSLPPNGP